MKSPPGKDPAKEGGAHQDAGVQLTNPLSREPDLRSELGPSPPHVVEAEEDRLVSVGQVLARHAPKNQLLLRAHELQRGICLLVGRARLEAAAVAEGVQGDDRDLVRML